MLSRLTLLARPEGEGRDVELCLSELQAGGLGADGLWVKHCLFNSPWKKWAFPGEFMNRFLGLKFLP